MKQLFILLLSLTGWMAGVLAQGVTQGEYFWGASDPGAGNGIALTAPEGNFGNAIQNVLANAVPITSEGPALFNLRVREQQGGWGPVFSVVVNGDAPFVTNREIKVIQAEYFWGNDPGQGAGSPMFALDGNLDDAIENIINTAIEVANEPSVEVLSIRVRDAENAWGPLFSAVVSIEPAITTSREIEVTQAEYFWGSDPGVGAGSPMFALDGNLDDAIETVVNNAIEVAEEPTVEVLSIRVRDAENAWGPVFSVVVSIEPAITSSREIKVTAAEYYFNDDPGAGNGTAMLAVNGNFNNAVKALKGGNIPAPIEQGIHVLWMRARDAENQWGPSFGVVVNMDTTITGLNAQINGPLQFCQGDNLSGISYSTPATGGSTYVWTTTNGAVVSGQGSPNVSVNWNPSGNRTLTLTQCLGSDCETETITITVNPTFTIQESETICQGQSIFIGGANQTQPGVYTDVFQTVNGCDSTVVTTLSVIESIQVSEAVTICNGESLFVGGANQTTSGVYVDNFISVSGCDSIVTTNLTVLSPILVNESAQVCQGGSIFLAGDFQSTPGNYTEVFTSVQGCDSVVVTNLSVIPAPIVEETVEICPGQSFFVGGAEQTEPGQYSDVITDGDGCETVVITTLVVESSVVVNESATICQGQSIFLGGAEQTEPGQYFDTTIDGDGCEITVVTTLTVTPPVVQQATAEICQGQSIFLGGAEQTQPGVYNDVSSDVNGCDVVTATTLVVIPPQVVTATAQICEGQSIFLGGANQTEPGVYTDTSTDANGCDIIVETTLEVVDEILVSLSEAICQGDSLFVGGAWQNSPGNYTDSFVGVGGCDSIVVTTLAFLPAINVEETATICAGDSLFVGGAWQFEAGSYVDSFTTESGCDSIITTLLNLLPSPQPEISLTGAVLTTGQAATYQWFFNGMLINGAVNQFYAPDLEGEYTVVVTNAEGCSGTSEPFIYITDGVGLLNRDANMRVYPNPGNGFFRVDRDWHDDALLEVYDLTGRMVRAQVNRIDHGWTVDLTGNASGTYIFMVRSNDYIARQRVMLTN